MEVMRHSDMRLTMKTYTDEGLLPVSDAVLGLPSLTLAKKQLATVSRTTIRTTFPFPKGHSLSTQVTDAAKPENSEEFESEPVRPEETGPVRASQKEEKVAGLGFEPGSKPLSLQGLRWAAPLLAPPASVMRIWEPF
jgi:hypothetical protein